MASKEFDYIIVGGGTAGCVVASRLSENPKVSVLLVERGPIVNTWLSRIPLASSNFNDQKAPAYQWQSTPLSALNGRTLTMVGGKALGGTTKINGLIYHRSVPGEYNAWEQAGRKHWGWKDVEPFFEMSENSLSHPTSPCRGSDGPWQNQGVKKEHFGIVRLNVKISKDIGFPFAEANSPNTPAAACAILDATIDEKKRRCSADDAFLPQKVISDRRNLTILPNTLAVQLDIKQSDDGECKVVGVWLQSENGAKPRSHAACSKEIVLCAGAIATPQLLLLSGIGPQEDLMSMGITVLKHLPGVGAHLQDHISVPLYYKIPILDSIELLIKKPVAVLGEFLKYVWNGSGILGQQVQQANLIYRSSLLDDDVQLVKTDASDLDATLPSNIPDTEIMFLPVNPSERQFNDLPKSLGTYSYLCTVLSPKSAGSVKLASLDPRQQAVCDLGTLSAPEDFAPLRKAIRLALSLGKKVKESGYPIDALAVPKDTSDSEIDEYIKENVMSTYHYSSTCRMDTESGLGVVDDELRVHGIGGLRIADASVFPQIPACHLQAPVVMIGERCARFIQQSV